MSDPLHHALLEARHGFAENRSAAPPDVRCAVQVHGTRVAQASANELLGEADAVVSTHSGVAIGIVTADCVPILAQTSNGVAAIHAGWRGLAAGVIEAGIATLAASARSDDSSRSGHGAAIRAAIGPCAGGCCYEVDAPVIDALAARYGAALHAATRPSRPGHALLDLAAVAEHALRGAGLPAAAIGRFPESCTICHGSFESFRRDGAAAGRMLHWIRVPASPLAPWPGNAHETGDFEPR